MTKRQIADRLRRYGEFVNVNQVAEFCGIHRGTASTSVLGGLPCWLNGREKKYFVEDVAEAIYSQTIVQ